MIFPSLYLFTFSFSIYLIHSTLNLYSRYKDKEKAETDTLNGYSRTILLEEQGQARRKKLLHLNYLIVM